MHKDIHMLFNDIERLKAELKTKDELLIIARNKLNKAELELS